MPLAGGDRLGPYEILSRIGAGGMGEVYQARDIRLDRTVAVKVLPDGAATVPEVRQRFEREARAVSVLKHPNICCLYDIGQQDGVDYLVMEYLEGETLADRLKKGPVPLERALRLAIDIAAALEAAHGQGVVHRDLKPSNIMLTPSGVKILDFGLARIEPQHAAAGSGGSIAQTLTTPLTGQGTIVGTLQYMAPEQLEGRDADPRTDLFAFGAVMYEMITGRRAFQAGSQAALISSIMMSEPPPLTTTQPLASPTLDHVVRTCLAKDPADRWQTAHDVLVQLRWIASAGSQAGIAAPVAARRRSRERLSWTAAALLLMSLGALGYLYIRREAVAPQLMRFQIAVPPDFVHAANAVPTVSPDGRHVVFTGSAARSKIMLWLRSLDNLETRVLPGTEDAKSPFWSPDSRFIGFFADRKLKKIDRIENVTQTICEVGESPITTGAWNSDGTILFSRISNPLQTVSANGGEPKPVMQLDTANQEIGQGFPSFLQDGRHFLYYSRNRVEEKSTIRAGSLNSSETHRIMTGSSMAVFGAPGWLLFARQQTLMAQRFDPDKFQAMGDVFALAEGIARGGVSAAFSASQTGVLVWHGGLAERVQVNSYTRDAKRMAIGNPLNARQLMLSPDEKRVSLEVGAPGAGGTDIWILELSSGILQRVTTDPGNEQDPIWSPDGKQLVFASNRKGTGGLYRKVIGGPPETELFSQGERIYPSQWLRDGSILFQVTNGQRFYRLPADTRKPVLLFEDQFDMDGPSVSPDGRWIAYNSLVSGQWEVYVASFPEFAGRRRISNSGGVQPLWRKDGRELFYLQLDGKLMSVDLKPGSTIEPSLPHGLIDTLVRVAPIFNQYAVSGDGKRFLVLDSPEQATKYINVVVNWTAGLGR